MTIQSTTRKTALLPGNGATTSFPFTFKVQDTDDIVVYSVEDDVEETIAAADYTVTLNSDQNTNPGGSVVMDTAPASGVSLLITTGADATQEQNIQNQGSFNPTIVMEALDKLTILVQQLQEKSNRALTLPITDALSGALPGITDRASKFAAYDADGGPIASSGTPDTAVAVSTFMEGLLGSASQYALAVKTGAQIRFYPEDYGAVADGATAKTDNYAALVACAAAAATFKGAVWIGNGKDFAYGTRLELASYTGVDGDGTGTLRMLNSSGKFDNTDGGGSTRYGADAVGVYATGKTKVFCRNVKIIVDSPTDGQFLRPLYFTGCTDAEVMGVEVTSFTEAELLTFSACVRPKVWSNYIHDCEYDYAATRRQLTGIAFDNDVGASTDISVAFNRILNLTCSAAVITAWGYESDGINIIRQTTTGWIFSNVIRNCGEGIDTFGPVQIFANDIDDCYKFGVKMIHGPHGCRVFYNHINDAGLASICLAGTADYTFDTENCIVEHNRCDGLDPDAVWSASDTACILFQANGGTTYLPRRNIIRSNYLNADGGKYGVLAPSGSGSANEIYDNRVLNASVAPYSVHASVGSVDYRARKFVGLTLSNNGTDATNDIDIAIGSATDSFGAEVLYLGTALTKRLDAAWAVGTNQGGLDTGSIADGTYHVWLIMRSDTRVTDVLFSTSATAPTMPTNYDYKAYIGAIIRASGALVGFTQRGDEFLLKTPEVMYNTANPGTSAVLFDTRAPSGIAVDAIVTVSARDVTVAADTGLLVTSPDQTDTAPNANLCDLVILNSSGTTGSDSGRFRIRTNTSRQGRFRLSASTADHTVVVVSHGWVDPRGREI